MITKEERIELALNKWRDSKGVGRVIFPTQFGKQLIMSKAIELFLNKNPTSNVVIISKTVQEQFQWYQWILDNALFDRCKSYTINYIFNKYKQAKFPFMIVDDLNSEKQIQNLLKIPHKFILLLSNNYEELSIPIPVVDIISKEEALNNFWISNYKEYKVILDVDDLDIYKEHDKKLYRYMNLFNQDVTLLTNCLSSKATRYELSKFKGCDIGVVNACAFGAQREISWRKKYLFEHPKKEEIVRKILEFNTFKSNIIFSPTIECASKFGGVQYNSKLTDRQKIDVYKELSKPGPKVISAVNSICNGIDSKFDIEIIVSNNSSNVLKENRLKLISDNGKIFTLVVKGTCEEAWFRNSTMDNDYITITEKMLDKVLNNEEINEERIEGPEMLYSY